MRDVRSGLAGMAEHHLARGVPPGQRVERGDHRRDADAGRHQHDGAIGGELRNEITVGLADQQDLARARVVVQPVRHGAGRAAAAAGITLDGDAPGAAVGRVRQAVLALLQHARRQFHLHRDVLTRQEIGQLGPADGFQRERHHVFGLRVALDDAHGLAVVRAALRVRVQAGFGGDQLGGQQPVRLVPRRQQLRRGGIAQHLGDRAQQMPPDDRVVARPDADRRMLVDDAADHRRQRGVVAVVGGIGEHRRSQRLLLRAVGLVAHVEQVGQLRVAGEHVAVEGLGDGQTVFAQHRHARIDQGLGLFRQHVLLHKAACSTQQMRRTDPACGENRALPIRRWIVFDSNKHAY